MQIVHNWFLFQMLLTSILTSRQQCHNKDFNNQYFTCFSVNITHKTLLINYLRIISNIWILSKWMILINLLSMICCFIFRNKTICRNKEEEITVWKVYRSKRLDRELEHLFRKLRRIRKQEINKMSFKKLTLL